MVEVRDCVVRFSGSLVDWSIDKLGGDFLGEDLVELFWLVELIGRKT